MRIEQGLEPLRSRIGELKLKEQAAALNAEQHAQQLLDAGADEAALLPALGNARPASLQGEITRLGIFLDVVPIQLDLPRVELQLLVCLTQLQVNAIT